MKRFNAWTIVLLIVATYLIASAFIPDFYLAFNFNIVAVVFFIWLGLQNRSMVLTFLGLAFGANYLHEFLSLNYSKWLLFSGIVLLGLVFDQVFKPAPKFKKVINNGSGRVIDGERSAYAKSIFSDQKLRVTSQNLEQVNVDVQFGSLKLDLSQAQFMTDSPELDLSINFGEAKIRLPKDVEVDVHALSAPLSDIKVEEPDFERGDSQRTIKVIGSMTCASVKFVY